MESIFTKFTTLEIEFGTSAVGTLDKAQWPTDYYYSYGPKVFKVIHYIMFTA